MIYDFDPLYSAYPELVNQTVKFLPSDTEERFNECKEKDLSRLKAFGWLDTEITYSFNSYGFRADEFEDASVSSILFLGCSYTLGTGIRIEDSFTTIVAKELGLKNYNLGVGGGGVDSSFRIGHHWIPKLKPTAVVFTDIFKRRKEEIEKENVCKRTVFRENLSPHKQRDNLSSKHWQINSLKGLYALKHVCHECNTKLYHITEFETFDLARDLGHPGKISNEQVAEEILTEIQNRGD
jgi:hypothetical protein